VTQDGLSEQPTDNPCLGPFADASWEQDTNHPTRRIYRKRRLSGFNRTCLKCAIFASRVSHDWYFTDSFSLWGYFTQINMCETVLTLPSNRQ